MIEREKSHAAGRFSRCRNCGVEPRHIQVSGRTQRETLDLTIHTQRHMLECRGSCNARTGMHNELAAAEAQWGSDYAQLPLALPSRRRAATARKRA